MQCGFNEGNAVRSSPQGHGDLSRKNFRPTVVGTAEATHAAFVKEGDLFAQHGIVFKKTFLNLDRPALCARQMFEDWRDDLGLSKVGDDPSGNNDVKNRTIYLLAGWTFRAP